MGSIQVPNSPWKLMIFLDFSSKTQLLRGIFGLPIRKDIIYKVYWFHRRKLQGYLDSMQFYKWEWPGSNKKFRSQKKSGKGRMGRRKAPGRFEGSMTHALRPRRWVKTYGFST